VEQRGGGNGGGGGRRAHTQGEAELLCIDHQEGKE
jgi:hypothetical protein